MNLYRPQPTPIDAAILADASLTDLPTAPFSMARSNALLGKQIQSVQTSQATVPVVSNQAPVYVTRQNLGGGQFRYRVQFFQPPQSSGSTYQSTNILLRGASGTSLLAASGASGPLVFSSSKIIAPTAAVVQQANSDGATSNPSVGGGGLSRGINLL